MALLKTVKNKSNVEVGYWNIYYFEVVDGSRVSVRLNGYLNKKARNAEAEPVCEERVSYETSKDGKFSYRELYKQIKLMDEFRGAIDD